MNEGKKQVRLRSEVTSDIAHRSVNRIVDLAPWVSEMDDKGHNAIHIALLANTSRKSAKNLVHIVSDLIVDHPILLSSVNIYGQLPLHLACELYPSDYGLIELLVSSRPDAIYKPVKASRFCTTSLRADHDDDARKSTKRRKVGAVEVNKTSDSYLGPFRLERDETLSSSKWESFYPLHIALSRGASLNVIQLLFSHGPSISTRQNMHGETPLLVAVRHGASKSVLEFLLQANSRPVVMCDRHFNVPLHVACQKRCSLSIIVMIVNYFPQAVHFVNFHGQTPLQLLQHRTRPITREDEEICDFLESVAFEQIEEQVEELFDEN